MCWTVLAPAVHCMYIPHFSVKKHLSVIDGDDWVGDMDGQCYDMQ